MNMQKSIKDSIVSDFYFSCQISFSNIVFKAEDIKSLPRCKRKHGTRKKVQYKRGIYSSSKMILEKIVYNKVQK